MAIHKKPMTIALSFALAANPVIAALARAARLFNPLKPLAEHGRSPKLGRLPFCYDFRDGRIHRALQPTLPKGDARDQISRFR